LLKARSERRRNHPADGGSLAGQSVFKKLWHGIGGGPSPTSREGVGLLAVPVLAGSSAYAVGEARRWPVGFSRRVQEAKAFYSVVGLATLVGMLISLVPNVDPVQALFWSAVLNGVVAVPVMAVMMRLAARTDVMGPFAVTGWLKGLGWLATLVMALAAVGMIITLAG
jgi:Mn2+/Fe2+ NRAMP family transporter